MLAARFWMSLVIISPGSLKRLVGQIRGEQFFSERIRGGSHRGGRKNRKAETRNPKFLRTGPRSRLKLGGSRRSAPTNFYSRGFA